MRTREQIYGKEAAGLLRDITTYHCLLKRQLLRLYPGKEGQIENLLQYLVRQGRIFFHEERDCYYDSGDFIDRVEYHAPDDLPVKIIFFADGEVYEIICVPPDKAALICHALSGKEEQMGKRLIIVESAEQIETLDIPNTAAFCIVDAEGGVQYFKKE